MSADKFNNNNKNNIESEHNINSNIIKYESSSKSNITTTPSFIINFFKELLQELYIILSNMETYYDIYQLNNFIYDLLFEYDFDPKNVLEIMTSNSQNIFYYSSLIGYFYQNGIGCKIDETKAFKIFSNSIKYNNQKMESNQFSFDQKNEVMIFDDNIKKLNEIILKYFYSFFLYRDIILFIGDKYKLHIKNAIKGDPTSQYYIGNCYYYGKNIKQDHYKAAEWYLKSSDGGNVRAMYMLGVCYNNGFGVIKDKKKAFEWYLKSAEGGGSSYFVGDCYHYGKGILKDESKAFEWYLKAAERGDGYCQYIIANFYNDGEYIPKNEEKGFYWNRKAAIYGIPIAQYNLAEYYLENPINKDESKAFKWYLKLANENKLRAIYLVAKCYRDGIGTDKNSKEATKWIEKYISNYYGNIHIPITLKDFLNGSDINVRNIEI